jgi:hypothetical protein
MTTRSVSEVQARRSKVVTEDDYSTEVHFDPPGATLNSLQIVEGYYGEVASPALLKKIRNTPRYQLEELADRLVRVKRATERKLWRSPKLDGTAYNMRTPALHDGLFFEAGDDVLGYRSGHALLPSITRSQLTDHPALKHTLLVGGSTVLDDSIARWAELLASDSSESVQHAGPTLAQAVKQLAPLAPLLRNGAIVLFDRVDSRLGPELSEGVDNADTLDYLLSSVIGDDENGMAQLLYDDPYLAWTVMYNSGLVQQWELPNFNIESYDGLLESAESVLMPLLGARIGSANREVVNEVLRRAFPNHKREELQKALGLAAIHRSLGVTPITSSELSRSHLLANSRIMFGDRSDLLGNSNAMSELIRYSIPSLASVSIADVVRIRGNEDIYEELRLSLDALTNVIAASGQYDDYYSLRADVAEAADEIVRPSCDRLEREARRSRALATITGYGVAGLISLIVNGIAVLVSGYPAIGIRMAGNAGANAGKNRVAKKTLGATRDVEIANEILLSLMSE